MKADLLIDARNALGEGIQWNAAHARLWWTDIQGKALWSCDADGGAVETLATPSRLGCFAFDPDNRLVAAFEDGIHAWDIEGGRRAPLAPFEPDHPTSRMNDGRCDRQGRFVAGGIDEGSDRATSSVIRYADGMAETVITGVNCTNGLCFSPDGRWMYFTDSPTRVIRRYPYDPETGAMGAAQDFCALPPGGDVADGACVDSRGALWSARWGGSRVQQILPDGSDGMAVAVDAPQVTCACFGGADLDRLYITTAREGMDAAALAAAPLSGGVFVAEPGVRGLPEDRFASALFPA